MQTLTNHLHLQSEKNDELIVSFLGPELSAQTTAAGC